MKRSSRNWLDSVLGDYDEIFNKDLGTFTVQKSTISSIFDGIRGINIPTVKDGIKSCCVDVPGLSETDIKVSWDQNILSVEGKNEKYNRSIKYTTTMENIDPNTLEATVENGVLTVNAKVLIQEKAGVKVEVKKK